MKVDRLKDALVAIARSAFSTLDYFALYRARVVKQSADLKRVDVVPDDKRLPGMSEVPIKLGLPGVQVQFSPGAYVLVGWEGGDAQRPHVVMWEGGESVAKLVLNASNIYVGGESGAQPAVKGQTLQSWMKSVEDHVHPGVTAGAAVTGASETIDAPDILASNAKVK